MKNKKLSTIILIILTIIVIYFLMKDNYQEILNIIINANFIWIFIAFILYSIYTILQAIPFYDFSKFYKKDIKFSTMIYIVIVTNFFNGITPLATGGQPLQAYELHKHGLKGVDATNIAVQNFIVFQTAMVLFSIIMIILNTSFHLLTVTPLLRNLFIIGFILNVFILGAVIFISLSKNIIKKIIFFIIKILNKLNIIKDSKKQKKKWEKTCAEFQNNFIFLSKNKFILITNIFILLIAFTSYFSIPICLSYAIGIGKYVPYIQSLIISSFVFMSASFLPVPGATGGMEYSFIGFFKKYVKGYNVNALLLLWRFVTYYLPTIIGGIVFTISRAKKKSK